MQSDSLFLNESLKEIGNQDSEADSFTDPLAPSSSERLTRGPIDTFFGQSNKLSHPGGYVVHTSAGYGPAAYPLLCYPSHIPNQTHAQASQYFPGVGFVPLTSQICYPPVYGYGYPPSQVKIFENQGQVFTLGSVVSFPVMPTYGVPYSPVVQEVLNWDENHRFNKQGRYCYCRKDVLPDQPVLQCVLCKDWFHPGCLAKLERPIYHGEYRYFTFSCANCNSTVEVLKEHCRNWVQTGQIALLHLIITKRQIWFKMREIADFLEEHWKDLCERHHTRHPRWVCILGNAFSFRKEHTFSRQTNTPFSFLRSEDLGLPRGYWTFKDLQTHFPEVTGMELEDNLSTCGIQSKPPSVGKSSSQSRRKQGDNSPNGKRPRKNSNLLAITDGSEAKRRAVSPQGEHQGECPTRDVDSESQPDDQDLDSDVDGNGVCHDNGYIYDDTTVPRKSGVEPGIYHSDSDIDSADGCTVNGTTDDPTGGLIFPTGAPQHLPHRLYHQHSVGADIGNEDPGLLLPPIHNHSQDTQGLILDSSSLATGVNAAVDSTFYQGISLHSSDPTSAGIIHDDGSGQVGVVSSPTQGEDFLASLGSSEDPLLTHHQSHHQVLPLHNTALPDQVTTSYQQFLDAFGGNQLECSYYTTTTASATTGVYGTDESPTQAMCNQHASSVVGVS